MNQLNKFLVILGSYWINFKIDIWPYFARYLIPHIWINPPTPPNNGICPDCGVKYKIGAYNDGEGWSFFWICDEGCDWENFIDYWFPYANGWANAGELAAHGVEVI